MPRFDELAGLTESNSHPYNKGRLAGVFDGLEKDVKRWRTKHMKDLRKQDPIVTAGMVKSLLDQIESSVKHGRAALKGLD